MLSLYKGSAVVLAFTLASAASADVRDGVEAWSRGDFSAAIAEWQSPAMTGDPDAMFNLAQAYRLGRGVPLDLARAEQLYAAAAAAGHLRASDTYGLLLFQSGRREIALPYVIAAARRGDPRAQYLLGLAHFNGDLMEKDWVRSYALLTLANAAGLPQAGAAIAQMDEHIPHKQRQQGVALSQRMNIEAQQARAIQLAASDLDGTTSTSIETGDVPGVTTRPSVAASRSAIADARNAAGTIHPAQAGADYAQPTATDLSSALTRSDAVPARDARGPWRVQLGAFSIRSNAEGLWSRLSARSEIAGRQKLLIAAGKVTKLQAGGFASKAEADDACASLKRGGQDCLVTRN